MVSLDIPSNDVAIVLSNYHIFEWDCPTNKLNHNLPPQLDLTIDRFLDIILDKFPDSTIQLQVSVPCKFDVLNRCLDSPNDKFLLVGSIIDVNFDLPVENDLTMYRSLYFGSDESSFVDSTKVMYIAEYFKVYDTCIQVTMNRSIPLYLLHTITILLFLRYRTLRWIPCFMRIGMPPISV